MNKVRAEENALLIWNMELARTAYISGEEMYALDRWANGAESGFAERLKKLGIIAEGDIPALKEAIAAAGAVKAPLRSFCAPESLHIELTARCPLCCPQCYKERSASDLQLEALMGAIGQADEAGVFQIALGGGEPLIYPHLIEAVMEIKRRGLASSATTSGYWLDETMLCRLKAAGLNHVQISLNGSNAQVNSISRDGFEYAVSALLMLSASNMSFGVNWVARADNIEDFPEFVAMAKRYGAGNINILRYKPSTNEKFSTINPSKGQFLRLAGMIKNTKGIRVKLDSAFSNLLCHINGRPGAFSGCGAGRRFLALDSDGYYRPCSHVGLKEKSGKLLDIWRNAPIMGMFRAINENIGEPCKSCENLNSCGGCRAIQLGLGQKFFDGDAGCPLGQN